MSINDNIVNVDVIIDANNVVKTVVKSTTVDVNAAVIIGPQGPQGVQGPQGNQGNQGATIVGATAPITFNTGTQTVGINLGTGLTTTGGAVNVTKVVTTNTAATTALEAKPTGQPYPAAQIAASGKIWSQPSKFAPFTGRHNTTNVGYGSDTQVYLERSDMTSTLLTLRMNRFQAITGAEATVTSGSFPMTGGTVALTDASAFPNTAGSGVLYYEQLSDPLTTAGALSGNWTNRTPFAAPTAAFTVTADGARCSRLDSPSIATVQTGEVNHEVTCRLSGTLADNMGIVVRYNDIGAGAAAWVSVRYSTSTAKVDAYAHFRSTGGTLTATYLGTSTKFFVTGNYIKAVVDGVRLAVYLGQVDDQGEIFYDTPDVYTLTDARSLVGRNAGLWRNSAATTTALYSNFSVEAAKSFSYTGKSGSSLTGVTCSTSKTFTADATTFMTYTDISPINLVAGVDSNGAVIWRLKNLGGQHTTDNITMGAGDDGGDVGLMFQSDSARTDSGLVFLGDTAPTGTSSASGNRGTFIRRVAARLLRVGGRMHIAPSDITNYDGEATGNGTAAAPHLGIGNVDTGLYLTTAANVDTLNVSADGANVATFGASGATVTRLPVVLDNDPFLRRWSREFASVRYGLLSGTSKATDVVVIGDSISEGWFGSPTNGTAWPQRFQRLLASSANTKGRYGFWVPGGTGAGDSTWFTTPRFTPATTTTVATSQISGRLDLTVTSAAELAVGGKFIVDSNLANEYTITSIDAPTGYVTVDALLPALTGSVSRICVLGTERISRGFSLRAMDMVRGSKASITVTGTSVDVFFRYVNAFAQGGIRFSVTDSVGATVAFPVTKLSATLNSGEVFLGLTDAAAIVGITIGSVLQIDNEQMLVVSVVDSTLGVTRGYNSTADVVHSAQATVSATSAQFLTFKNGGTSYCQTAGGQELAVKKISFPSRGSYTLLVEHLTMSDATTPSNDGTFRGASTFDGIYVHDGTEAQGVRVWNSSRFGSTYGSWNNTEKYQITTLAAALTANVNATSVSLVANAASVGVTVGSTLFVLNDAAYGFLTYEQMTVTEISGSTVTVLRAQNGTSVASHTSGYQVQLPYTSPTMSTVNTGWLSVVRQGLINPSLYVIALGSNDQGIADLTMDSRMRIMVATIKACHSAGGLSQPSFVFMIPPYREPTGSLTKEQWDSTLAQMYKTANDLDAAVWDWAEFTGPIAVSTTTVNTLASSMTSSQTTLTLTSSPGTSITVGTVITVRAGAGSLLNIYEKMMVRSISGSVLTVTRGHNGSSATSHDAGQSVGLGDPDYWSADAIHPVAQGQEAIGDWAASQAMSSVSEAMAAEVLSTQVVRTDDSRLGIGSKSAGVGVSVANNTTRTNLLNASGLTLSGPSTGEIYQLRAWGRMYNNSGSAVTYAIDLNLGSQTSVLAFNPPTNSLSVGANAFWRHWYYDLQIFVSNVTSTLLVSAHTTISGTNTSDAGVMGIGATTGNSFIGVGEATVSTSFTGSPEVGLYARMGTAHADARINCLGYTLTRIG